MSDWPSRRDPRLLPAGQVAGGGGARVGKGGTCHTGHTPAGGPQDPHLQSRGPSELVPGQSPRAGQTDVPPRHPRPSPNALQWPMKAVAMSQGNKGLPGRQTQRQDCKSQRMSPTPTAERQPVRQLKVSGGSGDRGRKLLEETTKIWEDSGMDVTRAERPPSPAG